MSNIRPLLLFVASTLLVAASTAFAQPVIDDQFDDDDIATNTLGIGDGFNSNFPGGPTEELNDVFTMNMTSGAPSNALLSKETFAANSSETIFGTFTFTEMLRPLISDNNGGARWYAGFYDNSEDTDMDGFDGISTPSAANVTGGAHRGGLWVAFKEREDTVGRALVGDEGSLYYTINDTATFLLETWTWDRSVFEFQESAIASGRRSDRVGQDLLIDLSVEISSDSTGYGIRFFSSDENAVLPSDMSGIWAEQGVTDLSSLDVVRAAGFAGQNGGNPNSAVTIELDRVYVDNAPQREADDSGLDYTWGARANSDGSWADTDGWQVGGVDTVTIPNVVETSRSADAVEVLSGTVRVDTANQGAWSVQVNNGATLEVASGFTLEIIDNEFGDATDIQAGGNLVLGGTLITPDINVDGTLNFADGTLRLDNGTIGTLSTSSDGTISNSREVSVSQANLGAGDRLIKERPGTLNLDQSGGANNFAATSTIAIEAGSVAALNDAANNALSAADVNLDGGNLVLSASVANAAAFDSAVTANVSGSIIAGQATGGLANETVTLGGNNGITVVDGVVATLRTADGYSMNVAGAVTGPGTLSVSDGASINLSGNIAPAILDFQGDTSNTTVGTSALPTQAYMFRPTADNPAMVIGFPLTSAAGVIIDENDDTFNGSVALNNASNDYTGTTRVVSGTLIPDAGGGSPSGDYDGNGVVNQADYDAWKGSFGTAVAAGTGADGNGDGVVNAADYPVWRDNLGATGGGGSGLPDSSLLQFEGSSVNNVAVLQTSQDFTRNIGAAAGEVNWVGSGGFAAAGGSTVNVTLEGGGQLTWDSATAGFNGQSLKLGSPSADGTIVVTNDIDLNNDTRVIELRDNQGSGNDVSELSGVISSSAGGSDVLRVVGQTNEFESAHVRLSNASNSYTTLSIGGGTVEAGDGTGLPATANLRFALDESEPTVFHTAPAIYAISGTFTRNIGEGPGEVFWEAIDGDGVDRNGIGGGFAAVGGPLTVTLEGGATLVPSSPDAGFNANGTIGTGIMHLGSPQATDIVTFTNDTLEAAGRTFFKTYDNPLTDNDSVVISGDHNVWDGNTGGNQNNGTFRIDGDARTTVSGTVVTNRAVFLNEGGAGVLSLNITGNMTAHENLIAEVNNGVGVFVNGAGTVSVDNVLNVRNLSALGGTGTVFVVDTDGDGAGNQRLQVQNTGVLRPGPDFDAVGTLTVDMSRAASDQNDAFMRFQNGSRYELEFQDNGGTLEHDSLNLVASAGFPDFALGENEGQLWNLELDALNDLTGLISGAQEFDFITFDDRIDVFINDLSTAINNDGVNPTPGTGTVDNVVFGASTVFDTSNASVEYEVFNDASGRIFVTGLELLAPGAQTASIPEPSTAMLAVLLIGVVAFRARAAFK